ncbi:MAG: hypothetical protein ACIAQZ_15055 [Sedimentisphaeraceae bacterium JB056]
MKTRTISDDFMSDLMVGKLSSLLSRIKQDHTLMLSIRKNYVNIYYRGGNILKVEEQSNGSYRSFFDQNYDTQNRLNGLALKMPSSINSRDDSDHWVAALQELKGIMDCYFSTYNKPEREFQQLIARENNFSTISNQSEYFVSDIELADSGLGARFDILALRWLASQRKNAAGFRPVLIEMKYGDNALNGSSGIIKHLADIQEIIEEGKYELLIDTMLSQFVQLDELGLMKFNKVANWVSPEIDKEVKPEIVFVLANHNPRSSTLKTILNDPKIDKFDASGNFDLRFHVSSFSGYALHADCMLPLKEFRKLVNSKS